MKQKLKMLVKIAGLQMSLWEMRILDAEPSYQATCVVKRNKWYDVQCRALSLIATLAEQEAGTTPIMKKPAVLQFRHNNSDEFVAGYEKEEMDKFLSEVAALLVEMDKDALKTMTKFNDWNDASNTKIPLNEEIFALLEDRMSPERLRPAVIVAKMMPAKSISWAEGTEGDVLCYDIPEGNFHCCHGADIKYWKPVNVPVRTRQGIVETGMPAQRI